MNSQQPLNTQPGTIEDLIKQEIIFGRMRPRERLVEDELCERFDASRHQVRAAFGILENMGLVTRRANKGVIVRDFSVKEVDQYYEMRALLQSEAAKRIPLPLAEDAMTELEELHVQYCAAVDSHDLKKVCTINNLFHKALFAACNNQCLADMIQQIATETLGIRCYAIGDPVLLKRSQAEHFEMLNALRTGNRKELTRLCVDHIWPAFEAYKRAHGGWSQKPSKIHEMPAPVPKKRKAA